jgi:hypothetical protein
MNRDVVVVLYENSLFAKGLLSILRRETVFTVEDSPIQNRKLRSQIKSLRPKVIIVESDKPLADASNALRELLKHREKGCAIGVNLNVKETVVYRGARLAAMVEPELVQIIKMQMEQDEEYASFY